MSYTKGPWRVSSYASTDLPIIADENWRNVARVRISKDAESSKANAHLIAAAPDLLEAMQAIQDWWISLPLEYQVKNHDAALNAIRQGRAAIKRAKGEE